MGVYIDLGVLGIPISGNDGETLVYTLWEALLCCGMCTGLVVLFREQINFQTKSVANMAAATYTVYLFHVPVVVLLQYIMGEVSLPPFATFIVVTITGIPLTFFVGHFLRKISGAKKIL